MQSFARLRELTDDDSRFAVSRSPERLGFYRNFERALSMAPQAADFVAYCDQDDRWHPNKLERLLGGIGNAQLVYSDARIVSPEGELVAALLLDGAPQQLHELWRRSCANSVTGAASMFRREVLDDALPFPPRLARAFHDHWVAVVAMARGDLAYVDEPLYDYVQHHDAVIGHSMANKKPRPSGSISSSVSATPPAARASSTSTTGISSCSSPRWCRLRCWDRMTPAKRRVIRRLLSADSGVSGLTWLGRRARRLWGHDETLDRELFYSYALVRRRAVSAYTTGRRRPSRFLPRDISIPADPGRER